MSKPVKEMIIREYDSRFEGFEDATLVSIRGIDANSNNHIRKSLLAKDIHVTVLQNKLARKQFEGSGLTALEPLLSGPNALVFGGASVVEVAREIVNIVKDFPDVELRGACLDGMLFEGEDGVVELSKFPTREEAIAQDVTLVLSPGRNLMGQVKGPGASVAGLIKAIEDKLEKGEEITKVG